MIKKIMICFFCCFQLALSAQEFFLKTGKNFTKFKFIKADGTQSVGLQKAVGDTYNLGISSIILNEEYNLFWEPGITIDEYKAVVGINSYNITWETYYLGLQNCLVYSFLNQEKYAVGVRVGANVAKIVYGKEEINGTVYDIKKTDDFKGFLFQYLVGLNAKYFINDDVAIGVSYNLINSLNASQSASNKFFINNNQISAGIYFNLDN
jgi:hypothetical protein